MNKLKNAGKLALIMAMIVLTLTGCTLLSGVYAPQESDTPLADDTVTLTREEYERLERYATLDELSQMIEAYYYVAPDTNAMLEGAKRGLLAGLGDPYTFYYNTEEFEKLWEEDGGEYAGIGIQISTSYATLVCTVSRVFSDSPAAQAGLRKGDILVAVEDLDVSASTLNEAVNIMRGEVGKAVHIQVLRGTEMLEFDIPRAVVHVNWVSSCMLDDKVGYILLYEFSGDCAERLQEQLDALVKQGAKSVIIDLRDNPGGWINDAVKIADIFLPEGTVTYLEDRSGERNYYSATGGGLDISVVVLMNENSASSSEIVAGALQDSHLATIVGKQSYGKGVVQYVLPVGEDGEGLQVTAAQYFTPSGRNIHKVGITPDVVVSMPEGDITLYDLGDLNDAQLKKAYEVALQKLDGTFVVPEPTQMLTAPEADAVALLDTDAVSPEGGDAAQLLAAPIVLM